ncbi:MAG TPA: hypothetical protein VGD45_06725 [Steroidobacter sp.]|uniref:hypothetical protein n=1 Tax=Steroidobacter sp. TaxID=1978227 RepID=UPI002ED91847
MKQIAGIVGGLAMVAIGTRSRDLLWVLAWAPLGMVIMTFSLKSLRRDRKSIDAKPPL